MKTQRNNFEMKAHDIQYKKRDKQEANWDVEYTTDWVLVGGTAFIIGMGIIGLLSFIV